MDLERTLREELTRARPSWPRDAGVIAAAATGDGAAYESVGTIDDAGTGPDSRTLYRIASISKVFSHPRLAGPAQLTSTRR